MVSLSTLRPASQDVIDTLSEHRKAVLLALATAPFVYYGMKLAYFMHTMKPVWSVLEDNFGGPKKHWLYGNLHQHPGPGEEGLNFMQRCANKYNQCYVMWFTALRPVLTVTHPETAKVLFKSSEPKQRGRLGGYTLMFPWIGDGLLLSSGDKWFRNRRLLTPAFHFDVLKPYMTIYNEASDRLMSKLKRMSGQGPIEIYTLVNLMTLNVILRCAFSYDDDVQGEGESHPYVSAVVEMAMLLMKRLFAPWLCFDSLYYSTPDGRKFKQAVDFSHKISEEVIIKRKKQLKEHPESAQKRYQDFLDILLLARDTDGSGLTDSEIRDEVDTFLFEGHDTTASAISWILYAFAGHPEIQSKAQQEVDALFSDRDGDEMNWDDLNNIPYTLLCIKEGLRLHSPVPMIGRQTVNPLKINGIELKPGTMIDVMIYAIHHNEHVWGKDANEFKPERFLPENIDGIDSFAFVPFAAGSRNCIGQNFAMHEIKVAVCRMLHRFELAVVPDKPALHNPEVVMRASEGMYVTLKPRK